MKKTLIIAVCLLATASLSAQSLSNKDQQAIDAKVGTFLGLMEAKNYTQTLDLIYPKFFEHTNKQEMFQFFDLLEKSGIELKMDGLKVLDKQALPSEANIDYALIKYKLNLELPLNTDELKGYASFMLPMLRKNFGDENVEYNREKSYIKVTGERFLVGVEDPAYQGWMFLMYDDTFKSELAKTLPAKVNQAATAAMK